MPIIVNCNYKHLLTMNNVILLMNYLAHAYLSFNEPDILAGNMISDFVKGKAKYDYPLSVQKGIHLHRAIDEFTDAHPVTARAKSFFRPQYHLYSGAFIDVVYDHFLALDKIQFENYGTIENFSEGIYSLLENHVQLFPPRFQKMFPYMKSQNWFYNYQFREGIQRSFQGLVFRATYLKESAIAFELFNEHYHELESCYREFFPGLKQYAFETMRNLLGE